MLSMFKRKILISTFTALHDNDSTLSCLNINQNVKEVHHSISNRFVGHLLLRVKKV